jgi:hypothetical protein
MLAMNWPPVRPARHALCAAAVAVVVLSGAGSIALGMRSNSIDAAPVMDPAQEELTLRAERRCPLCGWIESKREIQPSVGQRQVLPTHEYTIRMVDGSSHVFREESPVSWRLGERLIFIDGN